MYTFNSSRLTLARKCRGFTKTKLAELVGVELRSISAYENGEFTPEEDRLQEIAKCLRFPRTFFFGDDLEELSPDVASFRAMSRMTASQRDMALGAGAIALLINDWAEKRFELPSVNLPDLSREGDAEAAAEALRRLWGLGELSIKNTIHLLESNGVRVFSLSLDTAKVDAFSMWRGNTPFVFLNTTKSAEHSRFDAAHELGHLVMHRHGAPQGQEAERQANSFASALLMPRSSVLANAPRLATVNHLIQLKKYWTVSVAALAYRLQMVGVLTDWHYRMLCKEIARRGYRTQEPEEAHRETSQVFGKVFAALREDRVSYGDIADDLNVSKQEIEQLVFGLAVMGLCGLSSLKGTTKSSRHHLRVVG
jgi:Zn-dependent peptidase ImmA (M78 family)/DNA-binding XRE family transcriptional regulator